MTCSIADKSTAVMIRSLAFVAAVSLTTRTAWAQGAAEPPPLIAQQPGPPAGQQPQLPLHVVVQGVPGAQQTAAPDWIKPGMRLAFLSASASVQDAAGAVSLEPDPNGDIVDDHGNRFREKGGTTMGGGGAGYMIVDVVASEPGVLVLSTGMFTLLNGMQGPAMLVSSWGEATHPSGCDWFLHPRLLSQLQPIDSNGVSIMRHSMKHNGGDYRCVRVTVNSAGRTSYVYDLNSGVLLSHNGSLGFKGQVVYQQTGDKYNPTMSSGQSLVMNRFISARQMSLPWLNQQMPQWARTMKKANFRGAITLKGPPNSGVTETSIGLTAELATTYVGNTFTVYQLSALQESVAGMPANQPSTAVLVCGPGSIGGMWMDPAALRQLQPGQMLDRDPTTGVTITVEGVGPGQNGSAIVTLASANQVQKTTYTYDAGTGMLVAMSKSDYYPETGFTNVTTLQMVGAQ